MTRESGADRPEPVPVAPDEIAAAAAAVGLVIPEACRDGWRPARADLGIHTQPISFAGLPSLAVPLRRPGRLPIGLQLIGPPGGEATLFAFAKALETRGFVGVTAPERVFAEPCA